MNLFIVTGAAGQIGSRIANQLTKVHDNFVFGIDLVAASKSLPKDTPNYRHFECDVLNLEALAMVETEIKSNGFLLRGIVNCFFAPETPINSSFDYQSTPEIDKVSAVRSQALVDAYLNYSANDFLRELQLNIVGIHNIVRIFSRELVACGNASVVNIASQYGLKVPNQDLFTNRNKFVMKLPGYSTSKAAIISLTEYLASIYSWPLPGSVRFNSVAPGNLYQNHSDAFIEKYTTYTWSDRMATADDVVNAVQFLLSSDSQYINGTTLEVDSGWSRR